ncbi:MAG: ABC transporter permease [Gammaproteobacteria bacterium]|nr:ABC transporter permease [Gammaproteobacteria bacterium]MYD76559.1 ABC transporter permease [Gammaproteobacteria bacterium]MYJ51356.1 ABC transporter permease [Gammaproteobacteria bacterium]
MTQSVANSGVMTTADGTPLKVSLARAQRRSKIRGTLLVVPLFAFILITFFVPIFDMLFRSVENQMVAEIMKNTAPLLKEWDDRTGELPPEEVFAAAKFDFEEGHAAKTILRVGRRLNYEVPGFSSLFRKTARRAKNFEPPYKDAFIDRDKKWGQVETWQLIKREAGAFTISYYLAALDLRYAPDGSLGIKDDKARIYLKLFWRTLSLSAFITVLCLLLAYPIAHLLSTLPLRTSNLLMILVLLPFWTSLLVRTTAWIALLQQEGVINDFLVALGLIGNDGRLAMIHNATGTVVAMTHILLPFMVLPLYSVMKTIPPSYMRAAKNLGATPAVAFMRVYFPNTVSGIGAGSILVFIISIGYYITPALVGGTDGTLISNFIAYHMSVSLNWGLAAALGVLLLVLVLMLYYLYDKIVGVDNMKFV